MRLRAWLRRSAELKAVIREVRCSVMTERSKIPETRGGSRDILNCSATST